MIPYFLASADPFTFFSTLLMGGWRSETQAPRTLEEEKQAVSRLAATLGSDLDFEAEPPCDDHSLARRVSGSTLVVVADIESAPGGYVAHVREVVAGIARDKELTLNLGVRRTYEPNCSLVQESIATVWPISVRLMLFLRPDEFGVAEYRLALWGSAREIVNEKYLTGGAPTLRDLRRAVAGEPDSPQFENPGPGPALAQTEPASPHSQAPDVGAAAPPDEVAEAPVPLQVEDAQVGAAWTPGVILAALAGAAAVAGVTISLASRRR